jgi:SAM-dependent methyltransferase
MRPMADWCENDGFWEDVAPVLFTDERRKSAADEVEQVAKLVKFPSGASILDLGCGVGRHSIELARRGYRVTGVDRTAKYLEEAAQRSAEEGLEIEWVKADMREFRRAGAFDVTVNLLTSIGYFQDDADDRRVVDNVLASLKPGGQLIMDVMGKEVLARIFQPRDWQESADGTLLLEQREVSAEWTHIDIRWIVFRNERRCEHRFRLRLFSAAELMALLGGVGFQEVAAYGSLDGAPYDRQANRLVVVARRPAGS